MKFRDQQDLLADRLDEIDDYYDLLVHTTTNFKAYHIDAYDSDCNDEATTCAIFMASLSPAGSINEDTAKPSYDLELPSETIYNDHPVFNNNSCDELTSNSNVILYVDYIVTIENDVARYVPPPEQDKNAMILSVIKHMKGQVEQCNMVNSEAKCVNESLSNEHLDSQMRGITVDHNQKVEAFEKHVIVQRQQIEVLSNMHSSLKNDFETLKKESSAKQDKYIEELVDLEKAKKKLENIVYKVGQTTQTMYMLIKPQKFYDNTHKTALGYQNPLYLTQAQWKQPVLYNTKVLTEKHDPISVHDYEDTLITTEESSLKVKEKQDANNDKLVDYSKLNKL
ncbi:hypothetical protein Tco_0974584 [Tanacetum coccineum]|uniref:Uncharacterized protein n=1 Tax=Tanacetum coccineum TaxID=301880 RepID=A0ABQ5EC34_9ASTR